MKKTPSQCVFSHIAFLALSLVCLHPSAQGQSALVSVSAGASHSLAVSSDGTVWSWGANTVGQLGDWSNTNRVLPGTVWSNGGWPNRLNFGKTVSAGATHSVAFAGVAASTGFGEVRTWGENASGQLGTGSATDYNFPFFFYTIPGTYSRLASAGAKHSLQVDQFGVLWQAGLGSSLGLSGNVLYPVNVPEGVGSFAWPTPLTGAALAGGGVHSLALRGGIVYAWGANTNGQLGLTPGGSRSAVIAISGLPPIQAIAAGDQHCMALDTTGGVWVWGANNYGQLGRGNTATAGREIPQKVITSGISEIAAGSQFCVARSTSGLVYTWGRNHQGQLGYSVVGTPLGNQLTPALIPSFTGVERIGSGCAAHHALAVKSDGSVWAWGYNASGQLGNGAVEAGPRVTAPVRATGLVLYEQSPLVTIRTPQSGATVLAADSVSVDVGASDTSGIQQVDLLANGAVVASDTSFPLRLIWENAVPGSYQLTARATDLLGNQSVSAPINVTVSPLTGGSKVATPLTNTDGGIYATNQDVLVSCATSGASLYYTTNGNAPTETDTLIASGTLLRVDRSVTLKVRAFRSGWAPSEVKSLRFRIGGAVVAGANYTIGLRSDSRLWSWGDNALGQLGLGAITDRKAPTPINLFADNYFGSNYVPDESVQSIDAGPTHAVALKTSGSMYVWGDNSSGQSLRVALIPKKNEWVDGKAKYITASAGGKHTIGATTDGRVLAFGDNTFGQLGDGSKTARTTPVYVNYLGGVVATATGYGHSLALRSDGTVWAWGDNQYGQLGVAGSPASSSLPIQIATLAAHDIIGISAGDYHSFALRRDGRVFVWGRNNMRQLGLGAAITADQATPVIHPTLNQVTSIAGGAAHSVACVLDGSVYAWGTDVNGEVGDGGSTATSPINVPKKIQGIHWVVSVAAGNNHTSVVTEDGVVQSWGLNTNGQIGDNTVTTRKTRTLTQNLRLNGPFDVVAGDNHVLALQDNGAVWTWGANGSGQTGFPSSSTHGLATVPALDGVVGIAAGGDHSAAIVSDGTIWTWGNNVYGQLGDGTRFAKDVPSPVTGINNAVDIAMGRNVTIALESNGNTWIWGRWRGSDGLYTDLLSPVLQYDHDSRFITAGENHIAAITSISDVRTGGDNSYGQLGAGSVYNGGSGYSPGLTDVIGLASGDNHIVALKKDGTVWAWGRNTNGQVGNNTGNNIAYTPVQVKSSTTTAPLNGAQTTVVALTGVIGVAAGGNTSFALKSDGTIWAWGSNASGKFGSGAPIAESWAAVKTISATVVPLAFKLSVGQNHVVGLNRDGSILSWGSNNSGQLGGGSTRTTPGLLSGVDLLFNEDADLDGFSIGDEISLGSDPNSWNLTIASDDPDGDGLTVAEEIAFGSDPNVADTDGDGILDGVEKALALNPLVSDGSLDTDGDGVSNLYESLLGISHTNSVNLVVFTPFDF